jgi:galactokinase/mevalonate kinase-like predicted kinase
MRSEGCMKSTKKAIPASGAPRKIVYSAPGRCGIVGNPSDMYGGSVISLSTVERATVTIEDHDILEIVVENNTRRIDSPASLMQDGGMFDAVLAAIEYFALGDARIKISVTSNIPVSAGLSGSTAVITALVAALLDWMRETGYAAAPGSRWKLEGLTNRYLLAETVRHIELYFLKIVCGYQDAYMCAFGSLNFLDFRDKEYYLPLTREPLGTVEDLAPVAPRLPVLLAHTGVKRVSGAVHKPIRDRWIEGDQLIVRGALRLAHLARMTKSAVLSGDWDRLAEAMTENHEIARSFGSSSEVNERLIQTALDSGALAAKLAGAGKGGTIIVLDPNNTAGLVESLMDAGANRILVPEPVEGVRKEV